jgi:hypothetical protein
VVAGECGLVASDVGAAATACAEAVMKVAMWHKFEVVEAEPGQFRCGLNALSLLLQLAC